MHEPTQRRRIGAHAVPEGDQGTPSSRRLGEGYQRFREWRRESFVDGGETMPSNGDLVRRIESAAADEVVVLRQQHVIMAAEQRCRPFRRSRAGVPTTSVQGDSAASFAFDRRSLAEETARDGPEWRTSSPTAPSRWPRATLLLTSTCVCDVGPQLQVARASHRARRSELVAIGPSPRCFSLQRATDRTRRAPRVPPAPMGARPHVFANVGSCSAAMITSCCSAARRPRQRLADRSGDEIGRRRFLRLAAVDDYRAALAKSA